MALQNKKVSDAVIKRLPRYFRYLADLKENGVLRISSKALSEKMNLTASQIRQDLSCF
ncbi:MAG TPA: winged-helix domain-containing protein, partial [Clostridia bacterium]|nr:winged-helix domain-containing protein [Clostridia bacterium]